MSRSSGAAKKLSPKNSIKSLQDHTEDQDHTHIIIIIIIINAIYKAHHRLRSPNLSIFSPSWSRPFLFPYSIAVSGTADSGRSKLQTFAAGAFATE